MKFDINIFNRKFNSIFNFIRLDIYELSVFYVGKNIKHKPYIYVYTSDYK